MHQVEAVGAVCRCGHARNAHEHYRVGTECSLCAGCPRFRRFPGPLLRLTAGLLRRARLRP